MKRIAFLGIILLFLIGRFSYLVLGRDNSCANSKSCINNLTSAVENNVSGTFLGQTIAVPQIDIASEELALKNSPTRVLGEETGDTSVAPKHIYVDLDQQKLYAFEGDKLFFETLVSTGKWGRTPAGEYRIWVKMRSTRMSGGSGNDYYNLPNVPYVMFFYSPEVSKARGYSLHGAYWHNNFGTEMSHGCVNMRPIDAKVVYDWASPTTVKTTTYESPEDQGTSVSICNKIQLLDGSTPICLE